MVRTKEVQSCHEMLDYFFKGSNRAINNSGCSERTKGIREARPYGSSCSLGRGEADTWHLCALKMWAKKARGLAIVGRAVRVVEGKGGRGHPVESSDGTLRSSEFIHLTGMMEPEAFF